MNGRAQWGAPTRVCICKELILLQSLRRKRAADCYLPSSSSLRFGDQDVDRCVWRCTLRQYHWLSTVTNAAGGLNPKYKVGDVVVLHDVWAETTSAERQLTGTAYQLSWTRWSQPASRSQHWPTWSSIPRPFWCIWPRSPPHSSLSLERRLQRRLPNHDTAWRSLRFCRWSKVFTRTSLRTQQLTTSVMKHEQSAGCYQSSEQTSWECRQYQKCS